MLLSQRKQEAAHLQVLQNAAVNGKHAAGLWNMWKGSGVNLGGVREGKL